MICRACLVRHATARSIGGAAVEGLGGGGDGGHGGLVFWTITTLSFC